MLPPKALQILPQELAIAWSDGTESYLPLEALRRACPCALCKGEPDLMGQTVGSQPPSLEPSSFQLTRWNLVGNYGFQPHWADGHASGIFTWDQLLRLAGA